MSDDRVKRFWAEFVAATGIQGEYTAWGFGNTPEMQTELGLLVRDGPKRATTGRREDYEAEGEQMPRPGDLSVVIDGHGDPLCVIRTRHVEIRPFGDVDEEFAWTEGEGDRTLKDWRAGHMRFFASEGHPIEEDTEVVLERFDLLWPEPRDPQ